MIFRMSAQTRVAGFARPALPHPIGYTRRSSGPGTEDVEDPALAFTNALALQLRKVGEDVGLAHTRRWIRQDVANDDAGSPDAQRAEADLRIEYDPA